MYKIGACAIWNLKTMRKNPRVLLCLLMGFLTAWLLTKETINISIHFGTDIQMLEPFIWCFSDGSNILFASLALLLVLTQMPQLDEAAVQVMFRAGKRNWVLGQILSAVLISFLYTLFLLISTILLGAGRIFADNRWSDTATVLSYAADQSKTVLQVARRVIKVTTPYFCALQIFFLINIYMLVLVMLKLWLTLRWGKRAGLCGALLLSLYGFLLSPDHFMVWLELDYHLQYYANILAVWASPLQHASYGMHNFGYDRLPRLWVSYVLMGIIVLILGIGSRYSMKRLEGRRQDE